MKKFIAYFDYLGFKQFIENNDTEYQHQVMGNIFRDIESALGKGTLKSAPHGVINDLTNSNINCINFSDTIVFWSNDDSDASLTEILQVSHKFNWQTNGTFFPARGALVYGEITGVDFSQKNEGGGLYNLNSVYGKGLVKAHEKAEMQQWAGTVIDNSLIEELEKRGHDSKTFLSPYAKKFKVPYKKGVTLPEEYVMNFVQGNLNDEAFKNKTVSIEKNFANHKKSVENPDVQEKMGNTINFLKSFKEN